MSHHQAVRTRIVAALLTTGLASAAAFAGATPAQAGAVIPTNLPAPDVHGPVVVTPKLTYWVPPVTATSSCRVDGTPCFGYVDLAARIRGLRPGVLVTAQFAVHYNESFVCTNWTTLVKDPRPDRRVTLPGDALTEAGSAAVTTTSWGRATVVGRYVAHSPNPQRPDQVGLKCGPGQAVQRSGFVLSKISVKVTLRNPRGGNIGDYPTVPVRGTYTAAPYDFAPGAQRSLASR